MLDQRIDEWIEEWKQEGQHQGHSQGLQEGLQKGLQKGLQGQARLLLRQLELKFGALPPSALRRIEAADEQQILAWGERLMTVKRLDQIFSNPSPR